MMKLCSLFLILLMILGSCTTYDQKRAPASLKGNCTRLLKVFRGHRFDLLQYDQTKNLLSSGKFDKKEKLTPEEKLAILHLAPLKRDFSIEDILARPSSDRGRKKLIKDIRKRKMSEYDVTSFFVKLHKEKFKDKKFYKGEFYSSDEIISAYINQNIKIHGAKKTLQELGLFVDASKWETFKKNIVRSEIGSWLGFALANTHLFFVPIPVPTKFPKKYRYKIKESDLDILFEKSEDEVIAHLEKKYGNHILYYHYKERLKSVLPVIILSSVMTYLYFDLEAREKYLSFINQPVGEESIDDFLDPVRESINEINESISDLETGCLDYNLAKKTYKESYGIELEDDKEVLDIIIKELNIDPALCL